MSHTAAKHEIAKWDPSFTKQIANVVAPLVNRWFRAEVRGLPNIPAAGGALVVSNHSGGMLTPDVFIFAPAFYDAFGYHRPLYTLAHYGVFLGPLDGLAAPRSGSSKRAGKTPPRLCVRMRWYWCFPGGDYDSYRPTLSENTIDFDGRTGYVKTAIEAGVPIVPTVSIGGQETQLFLTRGNWLARTTGSDQSADGHPPGELRVPVRPDASSSRRTCRYPPRSSPRCSSRSTSSPASAATPISRRSTPTCAR